MPTRELTLTLDEPIKPISTLLTQDPARAEIGRQLFHDVRLSANNTVSCVSCHDLEKTGYARSSNTAASPAIRG
ncbi:cytochrome c peroxidase [Pseudomonas sp. 2FE]|uniref:cytochrome c peroxidase n=1 Tax=Pseudomonas sp. 2FE TaxID=2502190 RepID=UPI0010F8ACA8|nr:cytochrome c peroxidase [Pseudomonas sp. 2FE]